MIPDFYYQVRFERIKEDEAVCKNEDDSFTIFINKNLTCERQREAFFHAMFHIMNGDFDRTLDKDACKLENDAHCA